MQNTNTNNLSNNKSESNNLNLKYLSSSELTSKFLKLVTTERKITHLILNCINEIELRKLYLTLGYSSLFEYLTKNIGYTPSAAQRRIDGARLLRQIPELAPKIESGEINLTPISILQRSVRDVEKETESTSPQKVSLEAKKEILQNIIGQNTQQTEVIIAQALNREVPKQVFRAQHHQDESQSITIHFSKEEIEILNQARDLVSNSTQSSSLKEAVLYLAKRLINERSHRALKIEKTLVEKHKTESFNKSQKEFECNIKMTNNNSLIRSKKIVSNAVAVISRDLKSENHLKKSVVPQSIVRNSNSNSKNMNMKNAPDDLSKKISLSRSRAYLLKPGACCEYIHKQTGKRCNSTRFLTVDHIQPRWAGGKDEIENLQVLCSAHNKWRYQKQAGLL